MKNIKLPISEYDFELKLNELNENAVVQVQGKLLQLRKELIPKELFQIFHKKNYSYYSLDLCEYIDIQIQDLLKKINEKYPLNKYIRGYLYKKNHIGLSPSILNKLENIFEETLFVLYYYNYETNFLDVNKTIIVSRNETNIYLFFKTLFLKKHLEILVTFLNKKNLEIEKGNFNELDLNQNSPMSNHWTVGNEDIGNTLTYLDMAVTDSNNKISYRIENHDSLYIKFSFIFTINIFHR